jgi:phage virion morphogenesis protein
MADILVSISDAEIRSNLDRLQAAGAEITPMLREIGDALVARTMLRFERGTGPTGTPWPPFARSTLARMARGRRGAGAKLLQDRGILRQSITRRIFNSVLEVGTNVAYAAIHQFGGTIERASRTQTIYQRYDERTGVLKPRFVRKASSNFARDVSVGAHVIRIPARPFMDLNLDGDRAVVMQILERQVARMAGQAP